VAASQVPMAPRSPLSVEVHSCGCRPQAAKTAHAVLRARGVGGRLAQCFAVACAAHPTSPHRSPHLRCPSPAPQILPSLTKFARKALMDRYAPSVRIKTPVYPQPVGSPSHSLVLSLNRLLGEMVTHGRVQGIQVGNDSVCLLLGRESVCLLLGSPCGVRIRIWRGGGSVIVSVCCVSAFGTGVRLMYVTYLLHSACFFM
jgi:hypothetical protein